MDDSTTPNHNRGHCAIRSFDPATATENFHTSYVSATVTRCNSFPGLTGSTLVIGQNRSPRSFMARFISSPKPR